MQDRYLRIWAIITAISSYFMLLLGAIVTKTGSGEGCGDSWPFCHGQLIPQSLPIETVIEYSHRITSSGVGLLILVLTIWAWRRFRSDRKVKVLSFMSLFFVLLQGGLGALTVMFSGTLAKKATLALHFGFSLISFASVVLLTVYLFQLRDTQAKNKTVEKPQVNRRIQVSIWLVAIYTYVVVYTGAYVRHAHATMGCGKEFPLCGQTWLPDLVTQPGIHLLHRIAAIVLWVVVLCLMIYVIRHYRTRTDLVKGWIWAFILITLQAISGIATVLAGGQVLVALVHTTIISIFFSVICYLCMQVGLPRARKRRV